MKKCKICGTEFNGHKNKIYCSINCRNEAKNIKRRLNNYKIIKCKYCKKEFLQNTINKEYCSFKCRGKNYYKNNRNTELEKVKIYQRTKKGKENIKRNQNSEVHKKYLKSNNFKKSRKKALKNYYLSDKGKFCYRLGNWKRRRKLESIKHTFTEKEYNKKLQQTKGYCKICNKYIGVNKLTLDHIIPISKAKEGFEYNINDIQFLCRSCNSKKGNKLK